MKYRVIVVGGEEVIACDEHMRALAAIYQMMGAPPTVVPLPEEQQDAPCIGCLNLQANQQTGKEDYPMKTPDYFGEICDNCGCTKGSHHGAHSPWPYDYCPGHEHRMDWENGPGTVFQGSGRYVESETKEE